MSSDRRHHPVKRTIAHTLKTPPAAAHLSIDEYIAAYPSAIQEKLKAVHAAATAAAPGCEEKISYGIPTLAIGTSIFRFAALKHHIGLYPGPAAIQAFDAELVGYTTSKGAIQIPFDRAIPIELITCLIRFNVHGASVNGKKPR
jgi:uncharacterized protein YdhG (YjbR/CyaY superfamily)